MPDDGPPSAGETLEAFFRRRRMPPSPCPVCDTDDWGIYRAGSSACAWSAFPPTARYAARRASSGSTSWFARVAGSSAGTRGATLTEPRMNDTNGPWHLHTVEDDANMQAGGCGSDALGPVPPSAPGPLGKESSASMDDKDVHRLEGRHWVGGAVRCHRHPDRHEAGVDRRRPGRAVHAGASHPAADCPPDPTASSAGATGRAHPGSATQSDW